MSVLSVTASFLAIFVAIFVVILGKFIDVLTAPPTFKFLFKLSSSVKDLQAARESLRAAKEDIDLKIADAERQSRTPTSEAEGWKKDVDNIMPDIDEVLNKYNGCPEKRFFSYICSIYSVSTECAEYYQRVKDLRTQGSSIVVAMKSNSNNDMFATAYEVPGSLEFKYEKALDFVKHDNSVNVIGIWGMGGVGKTTLLKKIYNSCAGLPYFQHVIWITASSEHSNVSKLQSEIVKKLRLNENSDPQSQARSINSYLRYKNFILFIDDLWEAVDLTEVGVPDTSSTDFYKRKVVFTTRQLYVCGNMEAKERIDVKCLDHTQSLILFKEKVGKRVIQSHPLISELAEDVVKECKGLPLALITVGRAMSTKSNPDEWKFALNLMGKSQVQKVSGIKKNEIQQILKISYDFLTEKVLKRCFLSISLWPEDFSIGKGDIILCWMGLGIIENSESIEEAYLLGHSYIASLQAACLLEDATDDTFPSQPVVKMHDVLRDLAIWIASECGENKNKWITKARTGLPNLGLEWSEAECISLMFEGITELPLGITDCPNLHTLVLRGNKLTCELISNSFENFHFLKYLDLRKNKLNGFPESVFALTELLYLNLSNNFIETIPEKLRNLKKLKYLLLRQNPIKNIPKGVFYELVDLLVLDTFHYNGGNDNGLDEDELAYLQEKLLSLGITVWSEEELNKLMLLSDLHIRDLCIQDLKSNSFQFMSIMPNPYTSNIPNCLDRLDITHSHDGLLEIVFDTDETHKYLPSLNLTYLNFYDLSVERMIWGEYLAPKKLFANLKVISFINCIVLEHITWVIHLPSVQLLVIHQCDNMRIAIHGDHEDSRAFIFTSLKLLYISKMPNLVIFSTHSLPFPQLLRLIVKDCPLLKKSPCEFNLTACPKIQNIWGDVEWWNKLEWNDSYSESVYNQLFQECEFTDGSKSSLEKEKEGS